MITFGFELTILPKQDVWRPVHARSKPLRTRTHSSSAPKSCHRAPRGLVSLSFLKSFSCYEYMFSIVVIP